MSYKRRNPYMSINHGLIGGKREAQKGYMGIVTSVEHADMSDTKLFTFDSFDEMQNNPFLNWEYRLKQLWNMCNLSNIILEPEYGIETEVSEKYKSLHRFVGENEQFNDLIIAWNTLLDFDIENWFNRPYNSDEYYEIKKMKAFPKGTYFWGVNTLKTDHQLHGGWGGWEVEWYVSIGYYITANQIRISSSDTGDETYGNQFVIRKIGDIPYEIQE